MKQYIFLIAALIILPLSLIAKDDDENTITITYAFDVWSLGCIISQITSGFTPWNTSKIKMGNNAIIGCLANNNKLFPIPEEIPFKIKGLISKCMIRTPSERIKTSDLLKTLREIFKEY